jgi:opacity protein-like surface antigen
MRRVILAAILALALAAPAAATAARNPSETGTGLPSQSCQEIEGAGGTVPGHSSSSPGSPFNEPEINSELGGTGGQHYNETSQYDVACFQVS